jgi:protein kinase-like protein
VRANLPDSDFFIGKSIPARPDVVVVEKVDSGNDGHLFRGHSQDLGKDVACKIIPRANLLHGPDGQEIWRAEVQKADALRSSTVVKFEAIGEWEDMAAGIDCVVLISEFVEGPCLRKFISKARGEVTIPFITEWLKTMLNLLNEMRLRNIDHGDLHAGNVLVEDRSSYDLLGPRFVFRVTDFGVAEATSGGRHKDDYLQLAEIVGQLLRVVDYPTCSPKDKFIFNALRHRFLARHLVESDLTLDPLARQPRELLRRLLDLDAEFERQADQESAQLLTPFDFLSCEQIGDASTLLRALYSDRFLGLPEIESRNNVVVTGPRGCGKSTVFRSLSLDQRFRVGEADPDKTLYVGVYYRCDDLYFAFPRYRDPDNQDSLDIPVHFVTATLLSRLLDSLEGWAKQYFPDAFSRQAKAASALWDVLDIPPPREPGSERLQGVVARLNKERVRAVEWYRFANDPKRSVGRCFGPEVLQKACAALGDTFAFIRERPIYFFIDDYSSPKVTEPLQRNLNRIFMQRNSSCFFKLSTESPVSFSKRDVDEKVYVENREFVLHNLGWVYLHTEVEKKLTFIEDVFRRRLTETASRFPANELGDLVGSNAEQNQNESAREIRQDKKPHLWGKETLCSLCSGDIHYVISLVGDMVRLSGGPEAIAQAEGVLKISQTVQNQAIRQAAGNFLKNLRGIPRCGEQLVAIVEAFGNVARSHLQYLDSKNYKGTPPKQATRIEPYEPFSLSEEAQQIYNELLRYSVFIEDYRGKSRRGYVVPRLFLRRFLIPHFNLTFSTRDSIELEPVDFEKFLLMPQEFEKTHRIRSTEQASRFSENQLKIWPKEEL